MTRLERTPTRDNTDAPTRAEGFQRTPRHDDVGMSNGKPPRGSAPPLACLKTRPRRGRAQKAVDPDEDKGHPVMTTWASPMANLPEVKHPPGVLEDIDPDGGEPKKKKIPTRATDTPS